MTGHTRREFLSEVGALLTAGSATERSSQKENPAKQVEQDFQWYIHNEEPGDGEVDMDHSYSGDNPEDADIEDMNFYTTPGEVPIQEGTWATDYEGGFIAVGSELPEDRSQYPVVLEVETEGGQKGYAVLKDDHMTSVKEGGSWTIHPSLEPESPEEALEELYHE